MSTTCTTCTTCNVHMPTAMATFRTCFLKYKMYNKSTRCYLNTAELKINNHVLLIGEKDMQLLLSSAVREIPLILSTTTYRVATVHIHIYPQFNKHVYEASIAFSSTSRNFGESIRCAFCCYRKGKQKVLRTTMVSLFQKWKNPHTLRERAGTTSSQLFS